MKVLQLIQKSQLRGAEVFACQLSSHLIQEGHETVIVYLFPGMGVLPFEGRKIALGGNFSRRFWDISAWRRLGRIIQEEKPDIIQANAGDTLKYAVFSRILCGWKQPILFRNASTISLYIKSKLAKKWNSVFFHFAAKIISVSNASKTDFSLLFPQYKDRLITIPIGIEEVKSIHETACAGKSCIKPSRAQGPALVHVGGFSFEKNHKGLLKIFKLVLQRVPNATLHLVGDGPLKKQTEDLVKLMELQSSVTFYGFQSNALQYISEADVLLLPSIIEGLPGVILEAFYCKRPVVAYNVGGIGEVLINNKTGRLIEKGNETRFADAVCHALNNNENNAQLVENAYELVISSHLNAQIAKRFVAVYQSVLTSSPAAVISAG